jgi:hypothetical protein
MYASLFSYTTQHCIERHQARLFNYERIFLVRIVANGVVREFLLTVVSSQAQPTQNGKGDSRQKLQALAQASKVAVWMPPLPEISSMKPEGV